MRFQDGGGGEREGSNSAAGAESSSSGVAADRDSGALTVIASLERGDKGGHLYDVRTWGKIVQKLLVKRQNELCSRF